MNSLWINKYVPTKSTDFYNNDKNILKIKEWLLLFKTQNKKHKFSNFSNAMFIYGDTGIGKKSFIKILLTELGFQVRDIEYSVSTSIKNQLDSISYLSINNIFNNKKHIAILITDISYIILRTKAVIKLLSDYIYKNDLNKCPIIFISTTIDSSTKNLSKNCIILKFNSPTCKHIEDYVIDVCEKESIKLPKPIEPCFINTFQNNYRRVLYILENIKIFYKDKPLTTEDYLKISKVFSKKDLTIELEDSLNLINTKLLTLDELIRAFKQNSTKLPFLVHENFFKNINNNTNGKNLEKIEKINQYYDGLCAAYDIQTKIYTDSNWSLSGYVGVLSCYSANLLLNHNNEKKKRKQLINNVSPIFSKINYKFYNLKFINNICKKLNINISNFQTFTYQLYNLYVLPSTYSNEAKTYKKILINKSFLHSDLDKSIKLSYLFDEYRQVYTSKKKKIEVFFKD